MPYQVLIAENNVLIRDALTQMVWLCGCQPVAVRDLDCAMGALSGIKFDILITGVAPGNAHVPGFVYAARAQQATLKILVGKAYAKEIPSTAIVDGYLTFPVALHDLKIAMQNALEKKTPLRPELNRTTYRF